MEIFKGYLTAGLSRHVEVTFTMFQTLAIRKYFHKRIRSYIFTIYYKVRSHNARTALTMVEAYNLQEKNIHCVLDSNVTLAYNKKSQISLLYDSATL